MYLYRYLSVCLCDDFLFGVKLSTSIYNLVLMLTYICLLLSSPSSYSNDIFIKSWTTYQIRYSCLHLRSLHPSILVKNCVRCQEFPCLPISRKNSLQFINGQMVTLIGFSKVRRERLSENRGNIPTMNEEGN